MKYIDLLASYVPTIIINQLMDKEDGVDPADSHSLPARPEAEHDNR